MQSFRRGERIALVLALSLLAAVGPGCDGVFGIQRIPDPVDQPNAYVCDCTCFAGDNDELSRAFEVCVPPGLNPNLDGGVAPSPAALATDCNTRVKNTLVGIVAQCGSNTMQKRVETDPNACRCNPTFVPTFVDVCNGPCQTDPLNQDCSDRMTATSVGNVPPVCTTHPSTSARSVGRVVFGDRSICETTAGTLSVVRGDDDPVSQGASGVVEIEGTPCPGQSCSVDVLYRLAGAGELSFDSYAGFASVSFSDIRVSGGALSSATLDGAGNGEFAVSALTSSGRGTREDEVVFGTISDSETASYVGTNVDPVSVGVAWAGRQCALVGTLLDAEVEGAATDIVLDVLGTLVNQPPRADGGAAHDVECTSPDGATVRLSDYDASTDPDGTDPDGNIVFRDWWVGHLGGTPIAPDQGVVSIPQALGDTTYVLSVTDARMAVSHADVVVSVVDTTAPTISSVSASPTALFPLNHMMVPVAVTVAASDVCGSASCRITSVTSNQRVDHLGDGDTEEDWRIILPLTVELRAESSAPTRDRVYTIHVTCSDPLGNGAVGTVAVRALVTPP